MNALCYKIVFSKRLGTLVAVGEHTAGQGKAAGTGVRTVVFPSTSAASADNFVGLLKSVFASVALSFVAVGSATAAGPAVNTLPTGYSVNSGNVAISSTSSATNAAMTIQQTTDKASVNWNSFSIGSGAAVNVQQNNANSVLLNRVVGNDPSQIFGKLTANGQVILINPNGVVFGKGGSVTASAFTASTFGMTDADFNNSKHKFTRNGSTAGVTVEEGATIDTTGYVALMGASVDNQGAITTQGGAVVLAAGDSVALPSAMTDNISVPLSGKVRLELLPSTLNAMVANSGTITTEGGQVLMQAAALSDAVASVTHAGVINTTGAQGGAVSLLSDSGIIKVSGAIKANSTDASNKGGDIIIGRDTESGVLAKSTDVSGAKLESNKGFVETSGDHLKTDGITVRAKDWLLDPSDITISNSANSNVTGTSPGDITPTGGSGTSSIVQVSTIQSAINAGTNVTIKTTNAPNTTGAGNITIADALAFANDSNTNATLSLIADNGITQNAGASITTSAVAGKTGLVNINMTANGNFQGNTAANANSRGITLNAGITTNGAITLTGNNQSGAANGAGAGVQINGRTVNAGTSDVTITGTATDGSGVYTNSNTTIRGRNITIDGTATTTAPNKSGTGVYLYRDGTTTIAATNNLAITGTINGDGTGNGLRSNGGNGGSAILITAGGSTNLKGIQRGNANNTSSAVYLSGFRVNAAGDATIQAEAVNSNSVAINMNREAGALNGYDDGWRMQVRSTSGNVLIQANQGAVLGQDISGGVNISGRNVTLDNTGAGMTINGVANANGGSINQTTGAIVLGSGTSTYATSTGNAWAGTWVPLGVSLGAGGGGSATAGISATGNLTIGGSSSATQGLVAANAATVAGNINLAGRTSKASTNGIDVTGVMTAGGNINLTGDSTNATPSVGVNVGAQVKTTGTTSTTTLTSSTGSVAGTGAITTGAGNTGTITVDTATAGTLSGVISGGGSLVKQGAGTTILTGTNTFSGGTAVNAGTLQVGNGGTTGSLKSGSTVTMSNNANLQFNKSVSTTIDQAITGDGNVSATITGTNQNLTLASDISLSGATSPKTNTIDLKSSGSINQTAVTLTATNLYMTAIAGNIGSSANRISSNVTNMAMASAGDQYAGQANALTVAAKTTNNGNIDIKTTNGTLTVGTVNSIVGVAANGTGAISLDGTSSTGTGLATTAGTQIKSDSGNITLKGTSTAASGHGVYIGYGTNVTTSGDAVINGTTAADNRPTSGAFAGVYNAGTVSAKNITLNALATNTSADVLGYYGAGSTGSTGNLVATNNLTANAESKGAGVGFYMWAGKTQSGTGMSVTGITNTDTGVALDNGAQIINKVVSGSASGNLVLTGSTNSTTRAGFGLIKANIENTSANGGIQITASKGDIRANYGQANTIVNAGSGAVVLTAGPSSATDAGAINGANLTLTQNGNGGVSVLTSGTGNVTAPKIVNAGTGSVVVAAGTAIAAGTGTGGQVKTVSGNTISSTGKTYIYTGNASDTGKLENLMGSLATLYLSKVGDNAQNAQLNTAYANSVTSPLNTIQNGAAAQVMFRENTKFDEIQINPTTLTMNAGQVDPSTASFAAAVAAANTNGAALTKASITENKFKTSTDAAGIAGTLPTPSNQARTTGTYDYAVTSSIANKVSSTSAAPAAKLVVQTSNVIPVPTPVVPASNSTRVKVPVGSANPFALASAEDLADDTCSANSIENCHCEESAVSQGVDICYEPKAGGKGTTR